jgi:quercetin 2,3-dioxygenase
MVETRKIRIVIRSKPTLEGAGVRLRRVFGNGEVPLFDPFLLLDDFRSDDPHDYVKGFPWHPHRGIETITYVLHGDVEHSDSMGHRGTISSGDTQWMTAGSGIIHQEMPRGDAEGRMYGFQLWANLPRSHKMMPPRYRDVQAAQVPTVELPGGVTARVICGAVDGRQGPVRDIVTDPEYLDVTVPPHAEFARATPRGRTVFAYVIEGRGTFCGAADPFEHQTVGTNYFDMRPEPTVRAGSVVLFGDGDRVTVSSGDEAVRFLLVSGQPIGEPVAWYGPIVMNTREELRVAFEEFERGTFIK